MMKHEKLFLVKDILLAILIFAILILGFLTWHNYNSAMFYIDSAISLGQQLTYMKQSATSMNSTIILQKEEIFQLNDLIDEKNSQISLLQNKVSSLETQLGITKTQLTETTQKYEEAKPYQERVDRGQRLDLYYQVLGDYTDYAKPTALAYLGLDKPSLPANDDVLWERGRKTYNWLTANFMYCGDKGLRVGSTFYQFQFWSPDELLSSSNARCGDCDDFATLFAGLMYASGVPENKVWVVCGIADGGGHCWDWLVLGNKTYKIDPVCSQKQTVFQLFGLNLGFKAADYTSTKENVQCFSNYTELMMMNPTRFVRLA